MMTDSRNQSPDNSKVPFHESESLKENVNRRVGAFCLSNHELLMNEFTGIRLKNVLDVRRMTITRNHNQFGQKLYLLASVQEQVNICF